MNTEVTLSKLFDFQRFAGNQKLQAIIDDTESRFSCELSDSDLERVSAAGEEVEQKDKKDNDDE